MKPDTPYEAPVRRHCPTGCRKERSGFPDPAGLSHRHSSPLRARADCHRSIPCLEPDPASRRTDGELQLAAANESPFFSGGCELERNNARRLALPHVKGFREPAIHRAIGMQHELPSDEPAAVCEAVWKMLRGRRQQQPRRSDPVGRQDETGGANPQLSPGSRALQHPTYVYGFQIRFVPFIARWPSVAHFRRT